MNILWLAGLCLVHTGCSFASDFSLRESELYVNERCSLDVSARQSCGEASSDVECASWGCCYDPCFGGRCAPGVPRCYLSTYMTDVQECQVKEESRQDCGFNGISLDGCLIRGCCWKPSVIPGAPWCFYSSTQTATVGGGSVGGGASSNPPGIEWQSFENGDLPPSGAVVVYGRGGDRYYVGRISGLGGIFPSKIHTGWGASYFGFDGLEMTTKNYEALVKTSSNLKLSWISASDGNVPDRAIVGGYAPNDASHLYYVASAQTSDGQTIGYLDPAQGCATVSYGWGMNCYSVYKVLVWESE